MKWYVTFMVLFLLCVSLSPHPANAMPYSGFSDSWNTSTTSLPSPPAYIPDDHAPYISRLSFTYEPDIETQIQALQNGEFDYLETQLSWDQVQFLGDGLDFEVFDVSRSGFGVMLINCDQYPYDITEFRQAIAYAMDKDAIGRYLFGESSRLLDSIVPPSLGIWHDPTIEGRYYQQNLETAEGLLEAAGFHDVNTDGYREAPNEEIFTFTILHGTGTQWTPGLEELCQALDSIGVRATYEGHPWEELYYRFSQVPRDYEAVVFGYNVGPDPRYLYNQFHSSMIPISGDGNYANFANAEVDLLLEQLISSPDFTTTLETCWELQSLLLDECPMIPIYCNRLYKLARTDEWVLPFQGTHPIETDYWTPFNAQLRASQGGPFGGHYRNAFPGTIFLSPVATQSYLLEKDLPLSTKLFEFLYPGLVRHDPLEVYKDVPNLAQGWILEETPTGMDITFHLNTEATWSDGTPFTAADVAFSLNYWAQTVEEAYPGLEFLTGTHIISDHILTVSLDTSNYFAFETLTQIPILPSHIAATVEDFWDYLLQHVISAGSFVCESVTLEYLWRDPWNVYNSLLDWQTVSSSVPESGSFSAPFSREYAIGIDYWGGGTFPISYTIFITVNGEPWLPIDGIIDPIEDEIIEDGSDLQEWLIEDWHYVWFNEGDEVTVTVYFDSGDLDIGCWATDPFEGLPYVQEITLVQRSITGTVTDDTSGEPIPGVSLNLYASDGETVIATTETDAQGLYKFTWLVPGEYYVELDLGETLHSHDLTKQCASLGDVINFSAHPRRLNLELSGSFDFLLKEEIYLRLSGFLTDFETGEPVSGATVEATIYDPTGLILDQVLLTEEFVHAGIYTYLHHTTMKDLKLPKGIYVVHAHAYLSDRAQAWDMLQFHIDPPPDTSLPALPLIGLGAFILCVVPISLGIWHLKRRTRSH